MINLIECYQYFLVHSRRKTAGGFYLWATTPITDTSFAQRLYAEQNITVLPGQFLSRSTDEGNPGENKIHMALVAPRDHCLDAANRINILLSTLVGENNVKDSASN